MIDYVKLSLYGVPLLYVGSKIISYFIWYFSTFNDAVRFGKSAPVPAVTIYTHRSSPIFWLLSPYVVFFFEALPFGWGDWFKYIRMDFDWHYHDNARKNLKSDIFFTVGPGGLNLLISDADVITEIAHRWKDFSKDTAPYKTLAIFGQNVVASEGSTWQRHRKITGPPFNEKNSSLVFSDSIAQGRAMLASFTSDADGQRSAPGKEPVIEDLLRWTMTAALHVLSAAAFSLKMPWPTKSILATSADSPIETKSTLKVSSKHTMSFQESVDALMDYLPFIIFIPVWMLRKSPLAVMRKMLQCKDEFKIYMSELIADSRDSDVVRGDLLGSIVRASSAEKTAWTEEDTIGNIFIFILAGHETTASTLQSAIILLACHPEYQQQVQDELDGIWSAKKPGEDWDYEDFPQMRCTMALMLETLRRYPPVNLIPKHTTEPQTFEYRGQTVFLPPDTDLSFRTIGVQNHSDYWGNDACEFRPTRWLMPPGYVPPPNSSNEAPAQKDLFCPRKGSFLAFSTGFRACLGKKFAQVEFCTLIAVLLKDYSVELVREDDETWESAKSKAMGKMFDRITGIASRMREKVKVRFVKRGSEAFPTR